jgi:hypothetical protein
VQSLRRILIAMGVAGLATLVIRLRGSGGTPPQTGGWQELSGPGQR